MGFGTRFRSVDGTKHSCKSMFDEESETDLSLGDPVAKEPAYEAVEEMDGRRGESVASSGMVIGTERGDTQYQRGLVAHAPIGIPAEAVARWQ